MTQPPHEEHSASSPEELREQVEHTRHELGQTVQALAARTDVKARAQEKATEVKEQAAVKAGELKAKAAEAGQANRVVLLAVATGAIVVWLAFRRKKG
ncbi:DUF3618 domain-containing protein [Streptomyces sp. NPDC005322]|uniref:DUF3618 domain-containing protein n=1 Tax=unclassified Streptomyces TaxID=2593676 RepID=UPI0033BF41D4